MTTHRLSIDSNTFFSCLAATIVGQWDYPCTFFDGCSRTFRAPGGQSRLVC